ncbi:Seven in absentia protein family [Popillia japonica]|uniref:E3 ubiquitin-protein ligase n=1 Tax=Popillia japonica TaxID=7064 RepID=A0AAW1JEP2_POPJA
MHEKNCPDRPRKCPFCPEDSVWEGHISKMQAHLMEQHKSKILRTNTDMGLNTNFPMHCLLYDNAYKEMFHLFAGKIHGKDRDDIGYLVRYIGDKKHAKRFKFTLSINSGSQRFRNISISEICHDQDISFDDIIQSGSYIGLLESFRRYHSVWFIYWIA